MTVAVPSENAELMALDSAGDLLAELIAAAVAGNQRAWETLYERYAPLVSAVCRRYRLAPSDIDDVSQMVWMRLVQNVGRLRDPRALPGWIVTTAKHEALRVLELRRRTEPADPMVDSRFDAGNAATGDTAFDENLIASSGGRRCTTDSGNCVRNIVSCC